MSAAGLAPTCWLSSWKKGSRWCLSLSWDRKKLGDVNSKCFRETVKEIHRSIVLGTLNVADDGPIDAGIYCQLFLRDFLRRTKASKIPCNSGASVHGSWPPSCFPLIHRIYPT